MLPKGPARPAHAQEAAGLRAARPTPTPRSSRRRELVSRSASQCPAAATETVPMTPMQNDMHMSRRTRRAQAADPEHRTPEGGRRPRAPASRVGHGRRSTASRSTTTSRSSRTARVPPRRCGSPRRPTSTTSTRRSPAAASAARPARCGSGSRGRSSASTTSCGRRSRRRASSRVTRAKKERRKYGLKKARKAPQYSKR